MVRDREFIIADSTGNAYWSNVPSNSSSKQNITEEMLVANVEYLIDNIYVSIGNRIYRQLGYRDSNGNRLCAVGGKFVSVLL